MKISRFKSIEDISKNEWERENLDFAISDGIYEFAKYNEKNASFEMNYLKVEDEDRRYYLIMYFIRLSDEDKESSWYIEFLKEYFGERIIDEVKKQNYEKICMIMFPKNHNTFDKMEDILSRYLDTTIELQKCLKVFSLFYIPNSKYGYIYEQKPYMYFDLSNINSIEDYLDNQNSKIRHTIRSDRKRLVNKCIDLKTISSNEYLSTILELNQDSTYPMPAILIETIPYWEELGVCNTIGFFKDKKLVQFLTIMVSGDTGYTIAGNINNSLKEWSGIVNDYNIFIERCILWGVKKAYIGYECCEEKKRRGAIPLKRFLYVPSIRNDGDER